MLIVKLVGEETPLVGTTASDIIQQLKLDDWTTYRNPRQYKKNMKRRVKMYNGEEIRFRTDYEFLDELKRIGFIERITIVEEEK